MARHTPGPVDDMIVTQELEKIAQAIDTPDAFITLEKLYAAPTKYREGTIVFADTSWVASGTGYYGFHSGVWNKLG